MDDSRTLCLVIISMRETHVHIPNTLVKPFAADGSAVYCGVRVGRRQAFIFLPPTHPISPSRLFRFTYLRLIKLNLFCNFVLVILFDLME